VSYIANSVGRTIAHSAHIVY